MEVDEANGPISLQLQRVCHGTLPWLISFSLDLMRVFMVLFAVLLGACAATETQVVGPYATRLSAADVEEIKLLTATDLARLHIRATGPPRKLTVVRPDYVRIDAAIIHGYSDTCSFDVMKRHGRWIVDGHGGGVGGLARGENVVVE
jgi:hypothetical protein